MKFETFQYLALKSYRYTSYVVQMYADPVQYKKVLPLNSRTHDNE